MKLLKYLFLLLTFYSYSQYCPSLGPNQILPCGVNSTTLTADLSQCGPGGPNPNQTTNYGVTNIPYVAQTNTATFTGSLTTGWASTSTITIAAATANAGLKQGDTIQIAGVYAVNPQNRQPYGGNVLRNFV